MSSFEQQWDLVVTLATGMGVGPEAIRKWRERGSVPHRWRIPIMEAAKAARKSLDRAIFDNVPKASAA